MDDTEVEYDQLISERDFVSLLIELYRNRPVLWKVKHPKYLDKVARAHALQEISKELKNYKPDFTADKLKKKVNIIRTNYNKEKHRVEKWRAEGNTDAQPGLWYFNELLFLDEQETPLRTSNANVSGQLSSDPVEAGETSDNEQKPFQKQEHDSPLRQRLKKRAKRLNISVKRQKVLHDPEIEEQEENSEPEQYMTVTTTYYKKPKKREDILAETWAMKLKRMAADQKIHAEKIINDVLYEGEQGNLTKHGVSFPDFEPVDC